MQGRLLTKVNLPPEHPVSKSSSTDFVQFLVTTIFKAKNENCFTLKKGCLCQIYQLENKTSESHSVHTFQIQFQIFDTTSLFRYLVITNALNVFRKKIKANFVVFSAFVFTKYQRRTILFSFGNCELEGKNLSDTLQAKEY